MGWSTGGAYAANNLSIKVKRSNTISAQMPDLPTILERTWLPSPLPGRLSPSRRLQNPDVSWAKLHHPFGFQRMNSKKMHQPLEAKSCHWSLAVDTLLYASWFLTEIVHHRNTGMVTAVEGWHWHPGLYPASTHKSQELDNFHFLHISAKTQN